MNLTIKKISDLDPFQKLTLSEFSYSRIDTYEMCPSKYFYSYIKKEPRQFNSPAVLGNIIHSVLENTISSESPLSLDEMKISYEEHKASFDPTNIISKDLIDVGDLLLEEFYDQNQDRIFNVHGKEIGFNFIIGNYSIIGFIDRIDVIGDSVHIVDYKTGKSPKPGWEDKAFFQLRVYALLYWKNHGVIPKLLQLIYMGDTRLIKSTPTEKDLIKTEQILFDVAADILRAIERNEFRPRPTKLCDWCFFKAICPAHVG